MSCPVNPFFVILKGQLVIEKKAITQIPINTLLSQRWSGRAYNPEKAVSRELLIKLLEAARWSPSCFGDQPWRFIVSDRIKNPPSWQKAFDCLVEGNQAWAKDAPVLILVCANAEFQHNGKPNKWGQFDSGAAAMSVCMQATEAGLMVHQMGGFDAEKARSAFCVPANVIPMSVMAIGYQKTLDDIPEEMKQRELLARERMPLGELFFDGVWGRPVNYGQ